METWSDADLGLRFAYVPQKDDRLKWVEHLRFLVAEGENCFIFYQNIYD